MPAAQPIRRPLNPSQRPASGNHPKHAVPDESEPADPRIGQEVDPTWTVVAFSDTGYQYRCKDGKIVERER